MLASTQPLPAGLLKNTNPAKSRVVKRFDKSKTVAVKDSQVGKTDRSTTPLVKEETKEKVNQEDNFPKFTLKQAQNSKINRIIDELYFREKKFKKKTTNENIVISSNIFDLSKAVKLKQNTLKNTSKTRKSKSKLDDSIGVYSKKKDDLSSFLYNLYE